MVWGNSKGGLCAPEPIMWFYPRYTMHSCEGRTQQLVEYQINSLTCGKKTKKNPRTLFTYQYNKQNVMLHLYHINNVKDEGVVPLTKDTFSLSIWLIHNADGYKRIRVDYQKFKLGNDSNCSCYPKFVFITGVSRVSWYLMCSKHFSGETH